MGPSFHSWVDACRRNPFVYAGSVEEALRDTLHYFPP